MRLMKETLDWILSVVVLIVAVAVAMLLGYVLGDHLIDKGVNLGLRCLLVGCVGWVVGTVAWLFRAALRK